MAKHEKIYAIQYGLSAARLPEGMTEEMSSLFKQLQHNFGERPEVLLRTFATPPEGSPLRQANVRLFRNAEIRSRFLNAWLSMQNSLLAPIISTVYDTLPEVRWSAALRFTETIQQTSAGGRPYVALRPDFDGQRFLQQERQSVLRGVEAAAHIPQSHWPVEHFELRLATISPDAPSKLIRGLANLVATACPIEIYVGGLQFDPDPRRGATGPYAAL